MGSEMCIRDRHRREDKGNQSQNLPVFLRPADDPICEVTSRRHRVSPCTSAYYASPWRLLTLSLRGRRREAAFLFPESRWHLTMWGSRPSHFMIIPNAKRHPNNTKTDQLPIYEVITGLPRPYHNICAFIGAGCLLGAARLRHDQHLLLLQGCCWVCVGGGSFFCIAPGGGKARDIFSDNASAT